MWYNSIYAIHIFSRKSNCFIHTKIQPKIILTILLFNDDQNGRWKTKIRRNEEEYKIYMHEGINWSRNPPNPMVFRVNCEISICQQQSATQEIHSQPSSVLNTNIQVSSSLSDIIKVHSTAIWICYLTLSHRLINRFSLFIFHSLLLSVSLSLPNSSSILTFFVLILESLGNYSMHVEMWFLNACK